MMDGLALAVINDGDSYRARCHAAAKLIEGYYDAKAYAREVRAIVAAEAQRERAKFGAKFPAAVIRDATAQVCDYMREHRAECIAQAYQESRERLIVATVRRWFDKANGNSYFVCYARIPQGDGVTHVKVPFQYGYGSHPEWETIRALKALGILPDRGTDSPGSYQEVTFVDCGYMPKRDL